MVRAKRSNPRQRRARCGGTGGKIKGGSFLKHHPVHISDWSLRRTPPDCSSEQKTSLNNKHGWHGAGFSERCMRSRSKGISARRYCETGACLPTADSLGNGPEAVRMAASMAGKISSPLRSTWCRLPPMTCWRRQFLTASARVVRASTRCFGMVPTDGPA